jgi:hypothetical protein
MAYPSGEPATVPDSAAGLFDGSKKHILEFGRFSACPKNLDKLMGC